MSFDLLAVFLEYKKVLGKASNCRAWEAASAWGPSHFTFSPKVGNCVYISSVVPVRVNADKTF